MTPSLDRETPMTRHLSLVLGDQLGWDSPALEGFDPAQDRLLMIEADSGNLNYNSLRLIPDTKNSALGQFSEINGWISQGWSLAEYRHNYATSFGLGGSEAASLVVFDSIYGTSVWASFWKLLQPLSVVMVMVVLCSKLPSHLDDVRMGIPVTVLLTLVFLQQSYQLNLPSLPYLTFLDRVYVVCFISTLLSFVYSLWVARRRHLAESQVDPGLIQQVQARIEVLDNIWPPAILLLMGVSVALCWAI
jgi:hypothetical protein